MPTISKLSAVISADVREFVGGLRKGEDRIAGFIDTMKESASHVTELMEGIGVAFAGERMFEWIKGSMEAAEQTMHLADSLGITTEAMGKLEYAGKLTSVSQEAIATAMGRLSKNLADATMGMGEGQKALSDLGLNARDLMGLAPDLAFAKLADAIDAVGNPMQRLADAQALFGRGALQLMPMIEQGSAGLAKMGDEADRLGVTLSEADTKQLEQANEEIKRAQAAFQGLSNQLAIDFAPNIKAVTENMGGLMDIFRGGEAVIDGLRGSLAYLLRATMEVPLLMSEASGGIAHMLGSHALDENVAKIKGFVDGLKETGDSAFKSAGEALDKMGSSLGHAGSASEVAAHFAGQHADALKELGRAAEESQKKIDAMLLSMRTEAAMFGASDTQKKLSELANAGASQLQLADAHALADFLDQKKQLQKINQAIADDNARIASADLSDLDKLIAKWEKVGLSGKIAFDQAYKDLLAEQKEATKKQQEEIEKGLKREAQRVYEETRTPLEKFQEQAEELKKLWAGHLIDTDTFNRDLKLMQDKLLDVKEKTEPAHAAPSLVAGSEAAASFIANFQAGGYGEDVQQQIAKESRETNGHMRELIDALKKFPAEMAQNFPIANF